MQGGNDMGYSITVRAKVGGVHYRHHHLSDKYDVINLFFSYMNKYNLPYEIKPSHFDLFKTDYIITWGLGTDQFVMIEKLD
jgi:hypothetical protein